MAAPSFEKKRPIYAEQYRSMQMGNSHISQAKAITSLDAIAKRVIANKARYQAVEKKTNVPWWWIGITHIREASGNFAGVLHNGEKIIGTGRKTKLVPAGRGPFTSWEEAAVDAIELKKLHKVGRVNWTNERAAYHFEEFNGWGYHNKGVPSAYLWGMSSVQRAGKWVADHVWNGKFWDPQPGCMPLLKRITALDVSVSIALPIGDPPKPVVPLAPPNKPVVPLVIDSPKKPVVTVNTGVAAAVVAAGTGATVAAAKSGADTSIIFVIAFVALALAIGGWFLFRKRQ